MLKKYAKVLSMMLMVAIVLTVAGCGGGGGGTSVVDDGGDNNTVTSIASLLSGGLDLSNISLSAPKYAAGDTTELTASFGYFDNAGNYQEVDTLPVVAGASSGLYNYSGTIETTVTKNLIIKVKNPALGYLPNVENVIPSVGNHEAVKVETVDNKTYKKANIIKQATRAGKEINIAEVLTKIPPTTLYKLDDADITAIANAFIAVIAAEETKLATMTEEKQEKFTTLKDKSFELSNQALEWIQNGEYDEDTAWEIYEAELKAWALKNHFTREEYYDVLNAKNTKFNSIVTLSGGAINVTLSDDDKNLINNAITDQTVQDVVITDEDVVNTISEKKTELASLTVDKVENPLDFITYSIYSLTEAVIEMTSNIDGDVNVDNLIDLTNKIVKLKQLTLSDAEIKAQLDVLQVEFQKVLDILFGELMYKACAPVYPDNPMTGIQYFFSGFDTEGGSFDGITTTNYDTVKAAYSDNPIWQYVEWDYEWDSNQQMDVKENVITMETAMKYIENSNDTPEQKYENLFGTDGFINIVSKEFQTGLNAMTSPLETEAGVTTMDKLQWGDATVAGTAANSLSKIFNYVFMFEIEEPMSFIGKDGDFTSRRRIIVKKLKESEFKTLNDDTYKYKMVDSATGTLMGYARLWKEDDSFMFEPDGAGDPYLMTAIYTVGAASQSDTWNAFIAENGTLGSWFDGNLNIDWSSISDGQTAPNIIDLLDAISAKTEFAGKKVMVSKNPWDFESDGDGNLRARFLPTEQLFEQKWLGKIAEAEGWLIPDQTADIATNIEAFNNPFYFVINSLWSDDEATDSQYFSDFWAKIYYDDSDKKYYLTAPDYDPTTNSGKLIGPSSTATETDYWTLDYYDAYIELGPNLFWGPDVVNGKVHQLFGMLIDLGGNTEKGENYLFKANEIYSPDYFQSNSATGSDSFPVVFTGAVIKDTGRSVNGYQYYEIKDPADAFMVFGGVKIPDTDTDTVAWFDAAATNKEMITVGDPGPGFDDDNVIQEAYAVWSEDYFQPVITVDETLTFDTAAGKPAWAKKEQYFGSMMDLEDLVCRKIDFSSGNDLMAQYGMYGDIIASSVMDMNGNTPLLDDQGATREVWLMNWRGDDPRVMDAFNSFYNNPPAGSIMIHMTPVDQNTPGILVQKNIIQEATDTTPAIYSVEVFGAPPEAEFSVDGQTAVYVDWETIAKYGYGLVGWMQPWDENTQQPSNFFADGFKKSPTETDMATNGYQIELNADNRMVVRVEDQGTGDINKMELRFDVWDDMFKLTGFNKEIISASGSQIAMYDSWFDMTIVDPRSFNELPTSEPATSDTPVDGAYGIYANNSMGGDGFMGTFKSFAWKVLNADGTRFDLMVKIDYVPEATTTNTDNQPWTFTFRMTPDVETIIYAKLMVGPVLVFDTTLTGWAFDTSQLAGDVDAAKVIFPELFATAPQSKTWTDYVYTKYDADGVATVDTTVSATSYSNFYGDMPMAEGMFETRYYDTTTTEPVLDYIQWFFAWDDMSQRLNFVKFSDFYDDQGATLISSYTGNEGTDEFIPGGLPVFDKWIADNSTMYEEWLGDAWYDNVNYHSVMRKTPDGLHWKTIIYDEEREWNDNGTQNDGSDDYESVEIAELHITWQRDDKGTTDKTDDSFSILSIEERVSEDPNTWDADGWSPKLVNKYLWK